MKNNLVADKSIEFSIRIIKVYKTLIENRKEFILSKQMLRSGTSIGALIREAEHAQSKADFLNKMNIALKEANETDYWFLLLYKGEYLNQQEYDSLEIDIKELIKLLVKIVKTTKESLGR
ncbi:four helix bundle protein [Cloacibacterium normanense]|uniref:Four helix bundle protein n=1 Tax=Cloacibacterium normanense TaxID=237258 RepID=A0A2S7I4M4_9FLAO|nr:four helix bundle protein [Cloacibacterium normanense]PPZ91532.1 four helix bundle protein [Cloacibacterium normanense]